MITALLILIVLILLFGAEDVLAILIGLVQLAFWIALIGGGLILISAIVFN